MPQSILITGGTGLVGTRLTELLLANGHSVRYLSRNPKKTDKIEAYKWDIKSGYIDPKALEGVDTIVHLAGAGIADEKWTKERKKVILQSRTHSTQLLNKALHENPHQVKAFVSASAIGYYGYDTGGVLKKEDSRFGDDFLATVTKEWEFSVDSLATEHKDLRVAKLRIGIVLSEKGGALKELVKPIKFGAGAPLGSGDQYMSWVHLDDLCGMFVFAVENDHISGTYNAVAPNPVTNKELTKIAAKALGKPLFLPNVPGFALKLVLGEMASMVLGGSKVSNEKIASAGYQYKFEEVKPAVHDLLKQP
ncbi:TIGR01777 family protein [Fulvivirga sp. RKSG066]|uniref:TIGR01777 family oxidoreductase n=1 Tax=Fulvivirga aurantia TaxID=2529383 RepID=UPI0012BB8965|nr:TIGR01777 family oxidoreductase [Fulvivirga aurantia]MTI23248.1 TIGR01777 family protein [Fulvivirga aurantia]